MAELENLFALQDKNYREFHARLMPNIEKERIIGIRVPVLRKYAKELAHGSRLFLSVQKEKRVCNTVKENDCDNVEKFLNTLPHYYYEENTRPLQTGRSQIFWMENISVTVSVRWNMMHWIN